MEQIDEMSFQSSYTWAKWFNQRWKNFRDKNLNLIKSVLKKENNHILNIKLYYQIGTEDQPWTRIPENNDDLQEMLLKPLKLIIKAEKTQQ